MKKKVISSYKFARILTEVGRRNQHTFILRDSNNAPKMVVFDIYHKGFLYRYEQWIKLEGWKFPARYYRYDLREEM